MANNFRIQKHRRNGELYLNLIGDFDGSSAMELVNVLNNHAGGTEKIFVHTCFVSSMIPFGEEVFKKKLRVNGKRFDDFVFTGQYGESMATDCC